jgi:hypothetical protein
MLLTIIPKTEKSVSGPFCITRALRILRVLSIRGGYILSDRLIGWGSDFFGNSIHLAPRTTRRVNSHMVPIWVSLFPAFCLFLGIALSFLFVQTGFLS